VCCPANGAYRVTRLEAVLLGKRKTATSGEAFDASIGVERETLAFIRFLTGFSPEEYTR
jgi:hypothetical protein